MLHRSSELSADLLDAVARETAGLEALPDGQAAVRAGGSAGWSRKKELGHLLDSATNNRVRFASAALAGSYVGPTYDGEGWVELGGYQEMEWAELVRLWVAQNKALAGLIANIPDERLTAPCQVGETDAVTLGFLIEDYVLHMQHHLDHILGREVSTSYPGANMGV